MADLGKLEEEEKRAHAEWQMRIAEALIPLISENDKLGLQVMRIHYAIRTKEGKGLLTYGNLGITPPHRAEDAIKLIDKMAALQDDKEGNRTFAAVGKVKRS